MKIIILSVIYTLLAAVSLQAQIANSLTLNVIAAGVGENEYISVAGNHPALGNWNPGIVKLEKVDSVTWSKTISLPSNYEVEYKIIRGGDWSKQAVFVRGEIPDNITLTLSADTTVYVTVPYWADQFTFFVAGQVTGKVDRIENFSDGIVPERNILVWLPPGYDEDNMKRYPVLYMHDGQNVFDPVTSTLGIDWQIDETADSLIRNEVIEPLIVVGIYNTSYRRHEYSDTQRGQDYMNFIVNHLKQYIDKNYRTLPGRESTAVGGSSLGALISFMLLWEYPDVFSKALCMSGAFKIDTIDYVSKVIKEDRPAYDIKVYFDNGGVGLENLLQPGIDELIGVLNKKGFEEGNDYLVIIDQQAHHNERAWSSRMWMPLEFFFGRKID